MSAIRISHFSDVLCVWAYVSQVRIDELRRTFGGQIDLDCRFVSVFGDARGKLAKNWEARGGAAAYRDHVLEVVGRFGHVPVHPEVWTRNTPASSLPGHAFLCAVRRLERAGEAPAGACDAAAWRLREAFFRDLVDVSRRSALLAVAEEAGLAVAAIEAELDDGAAYAALAEDLELAREQDVRASPTMLFNEGRQRLTGNVGYRIIEANVRELLERPAGQQSWC